MLFFDTENSEKEKELLGGLEKLNWIKDTS